MINYNVYMIEDLIQKHENFLRVIARANEITKSQCGAQVLSPGFGSDVKAARLKSLTPGEIIQALEDPQGVYLIDLELKRFDKQEPNPKALLDKFTSTSGGVYSKIEERYAALKREFASDEGVAQALQKFSLAVHLLLWCDMLRKPAMIVSTEVAAAVIAAIRRLSLAAAYVEGFPSYDKVKDDDLKFWAERILALLDHWKQIELLTPAWFSKNIGSGWGSLEEDGLPHNPDWTNLPRQKHKEYVKSVFPWCPDSWWDDDLKAHALHECLKRVAGSHAQWMGNIGDHPLSLGGAYLVFLTALAKKSPSSLSEPYIIKDMTPFCRIVQSEQFANGFPEQIPFMASQDQQCARHTIESLYDFFLQIILRQDQATFGLKGFAPPSREKPYFSIKLNWDPKDRERLAQTIRGKVCGALDADPPQLSLPSGKTAGSLLRFILASQARKYGFGANGTIRLDDAPSKPDRGWLRVGQFDGIR